MNRVSFLNLFPFIFALGCIATETDDDALSSDDDSTELLVDDDVAGDDSSDDDDSSIVPVEFVRITRTDVAEPFGPIIEVHPGERIGMVLFELESEPEGMLFTIDSWTSLLLVSEDAVDYYDGYGGGHYVTENIESCTLARWALENNTFIEEDLTAPMTPPLDGVIVFTNMNAGPFDRVFVEVRCTFTTTPPHGEWDGFAAVIVAGTDILLSDAEDEPITTELVDGNGTMTEDWMWHPVSQRLLVP